MSSSTYFAATLIAEHSQSACHTASRIDKIPHGREDGRATSRKQRWGRVAVLGLSALTCLAAVLCNSLAILSGHLFLRCIPDPLLISRTAFTDATLESTFIIATLGTTVTSVPLFVDAILFWHQVADEQTYPTIPSLKPLYQLIPRSVSSPLQAVLWECWLILAGPIGLLLYSAFYPQSSDTLGIMGILLAASVGRLTAIAVRWAYGRWRTFQTHAAQISETEVDAELAQLRAETWDGDTLQHAAEEGFARK
ncbi:hypothetical protein L226DRAFT_530089 [Lentinus tigrinus ALCF2SS1-7]|uniref:Uncharacterized protein n=1 Tax=Lentinus tigrinus ALCF2SS1-6 TaxID=1328759 RepID=A0A5C2SRI7_9APHY|nr:hypothetical protein L227DRAFT_569888 [Lentinus tigrinus ALCF2SS1-6]RPD79896.1 hypothetical protein L226DRAFT_530089 [Lentinus tigrinus ALCF2SS1-7]